MAQHLVGSLTDLSAQTTSVADHCIPVNFVLLCADVHLPINVSIAVPLRHILVLVVHIGSC